MNETHEFKQRVLEEKLFEELKDKVVMRSDEMRKKYKNINVSRLRTRIVNYQIETYGNQLDNFAQIPSKEEAIRKALNVRMRWYMRRRKR